MHRRHAGQDSSIASDSMRQEEANSRAPALQEIYDQYIAKYTLRCVIDSSFNLGVGRYRLHVEHVCTFDSGIIVPGSYVHMYKLDSFITHDFVTRITLQKNGKKTLERTDDHPELQYLDPVDGCRTAATASIDEKGGIHFKVGD